MNKKQPDHLYTFKVKNIQGTTQQLSQYKGKLLLIVNTASRCGFTPQYTGLEALYQKYKNKGLEILAFPCNQFGSQEPGTHEEIAAFCDLNYKTTFPLFEKIDVNGPKAHPLFKYLTGALPGLLGTQNIKWNFTKFLIDRDGTPLKRFAPGDRPQKIEKDIIKNLGN
ncbi:MAG: glutathione peroxidase [Deltaproteobacteria bacterium]|nr:glutathione peroxidase [Deltaproteobacteria bacterium]